MLTAERRGRISLDDIGRCLGALGGLPIQTDEAPDLQAAYDLARKYELSFYDAMYLELAKRQRAYMATLDRRLGSAAASEGVLLLAI